MASYDPRFTPARSDLAAAHLEGQVPAARYVAGTDYQATGGRIALRHAPRREAAQDDELLFGERFTAYEEKEGWLWGQVQRDSYVGYVRTEGFTVARPTATHRVKSFSTPLLCAPDPKSAARDLLPLNALIRVKAMKGRFAELDEGFVFAPHLAAGNDAAPDWVTVAEGFTGAPYLWGGITIAGVDCSGLVHAALAAANMPSPRDTDMMEAALGHAVEIGAGLRRGDLVFWKGHVGVMRDADSLLHANAHSMDVRSESLTTVSARVALEVGAIRAIKRLS